MAVESVLRAGLRRAGDAGRLGVRSQYLTVEELDDLLDLTLNFLWERRTDPSPIEGWWLSAGGVRPWWESEASLDERDALSIRPLRTEVYDLLEERGHIVKGPGNNVPIHVAPPALRSERPSAAETITVSERGAGYGDAEHNAQVEKAAMDLATASYEADGWRVSDVSKQNLGWDLTADRHDDELHLEVKGVSGAQPNFLLTVNEHTIAGVDPAWRLVVVTQALTTPVLTKFEASEVLAASTPHVFRVRLG